MELEYTIETVEDPRFVIQFLEDKLYQYNSDRTNKHDGRLFAAVIRDRTRTITGGVAGWTWAYACEITQLWVAEAARNKGIGGKLLEAAEAEARTRRCRSILVRSYSFQAPAFYEKHGYRIEHVIDDFPDGYRYYTLMKAIQPEAIEQG